MSRSERRVLRCLSALARSLLASCSTYRERPLYPVATESEFRSHTLAGPGLRKFMETCFPETPASWDLAALTLAAFYFHPDLDQARARVASAEAGITTAGMVPKTTAGGWSWIGQGGI